MRTVLSAIAALDDVSVDQVIVSNSKGSIVSGRQRSVKLVILLNSVKGVSHIQDVLTIVKNIDLNIHPLFLVPPNHHGQWESVAAGLDIVMNHRWALVLQL